MSDARVLVTGATGRIGAGVVRGLVDAGHAAPRVLVRDAARASAMLPPQAEIMVGDFADTDALNKAMQGVRAVLLVSPVHPDQCRLQGNVARAAAASGLDPHIVKISGLGTALDSYVDSGRWHAQTEHEIAALGLPFTFLRPLFFMQNLGFMLRGARRDGVIRGAVGDALIAMVDARDIADVAVLALTGEERLRNRAVTLTEAVARSYQDVAELMSTVLDRNVVYRRQTRRQLLQALEARNEPAWHRRILDQFNRAFIDGWGSEPTDVVGELLQRPARTLPAYLAEAATAAETGAGVDPFPS